MNQLAPLAGSAPAAFASAGNLPDMNAAAQAGLMPSFAVIGYKGRNWRIKHRQNEELLLDGRGVPIPTLPVVIVGISSAVSKLYYEKRYQEGDQEAPDCYSNDGIHPDPAAAKPQAPNCAACPMNVFGSRINENGKKTKACQDSRRIAVVPRGDIQNERYGGPMLLRLPTMSLANLDKYARDLQRFNAQPFMVQTDIGFDYDVAYPQITFQAAGWLTEPEVPAVLDQLKNPIIDRMINDAPVDLAGEAPA